VQRREFHLLENGPNRQVDAKMRRRDGLLAFEVKLLFSRPNEMSLQRSRLGRYGSSRSFSLMKSSSAVEASMGGGFSMGARGPLLPTMMATFSIDTSGLFPSDYKLQAPDLMVGQKSASSGPGHRPALLPT